MLSQDRKLGVGSSIRVFVLLAVCSPLAGQVSNVDEHAQQKDYWIDQTTGLMWTLHDNGEDISWKKAVKYCAKSKLEGYTDWTLPSIEQLEVIYDGSGFQAEHPVGIEIAFAGKAKGGLQLTGNREWSSTRVPFPYGKLISNYVWEYSFRGGFRFKDPQGYDHTLRALCVRQTR